MCGWYRRAAWARGRPRKPNGCEGQGALVTQPQEGLVHPGRNHSVQRVYILPKERRLRPGIWPLVLHHCTIQLLRQLHHPREHLVRCQRSQHSSARDLSSGKTCISGAFCLTGSWWFYWVFSDFVDMNWFWAENEVVDVLHFSVTACCGHILCWEGQRFLSWTCRRLEAAGCGGGRKHLLLDGSFSLVTMSVFQSLTGWGILKNQERRRNFFLRTLLVNLRQWNISLWGIGIWWKVNWCSCRNLKLGTELSFLCQISHFFFFFMSKFPNIRKSQILALRDSVIFQTP